MENLKSIVIWTTGIFAAIIISISIVLAIDMLRIIPPPPALIINGTETEQLAKGKEITNYKDLTSVLQTQRTNAFGIVVSQTLLPMLTSLITAVISYIFAKAGVQLFSTYINSRKKSSQ